MNPRTIFRFLFGCISGTLLIINPVYAQVQITGLELQKILGANTTHYYTEPAEGNFNIGKSGGPNIYDFTSIGLEGMQISNCYQISEIPILAIRYPAAASVFGETPATVENNPVFYFNNDSVFMCGDASVIPLHKFRHYRPFELLTPLPVTYGTGFSMTVTSYDTTFDTMGGVLETESSTSLEVTSIDGYGTLKLANGNFECLRVRKHYSQNEGGDKEFIFMTREGVLLLVGGIEHSAPDTGVVNAYMQLLLASPLVNIENEKPAVITSFQLEQNYPNPFNPNTTIIFNLPEEDFVTLTIYNSLGEEKVQLISNTMPSGRHEVEFNANDYTSGIYFYRLQAGSFTETKKMMLMK